MVSATPVEDDTWHLVGHKNFVRNNPRSDLFPVNRFHHIEFWCADATTSYKRFQHGLGMTLVAKSDQSTGNSTFASYVLQSNDLVFTFTAPYSKQVAQNSVPGSVPLPYYSQADAFDFIMKHGLAVRAIGISVDDADAAFQKAVTNGAEAAQAPTLLSSSHQSPEGGEGALETQCVSELRLYGDVVMRFVGSGNFEGPYLAGYVAVEDAPTICYGITRLDHAVGNVHKLPEAASHIMRWTGFHEFAEFVAEDVGTLDSGLNSVVLANNNEYVLLPINEPTFGTPRKSQIQTYLEQNEGPGLQHLALKTEDIFETLRKMRSCSHCGGFEFMPQPSDQYYKELPGKVGNALSSGQIAECQALGILVDKDDQGLLLQIFTKPLGDRPTVFIEIIQRVGCLSTSAQSGMEQEAHKRPTGEKQAAGCGGFGKGNFSELFKRIEEYERTLNV